MADNSTFDPGTGGDTYRSKDRAGVKTELVGLDLNPAGAEQLMATAALADATSNPTTAPWAGMLMCFNGTTWDRLRGDTTNGIFANVKTSVLPTGAATAAKQPALGTAGSASADVISIQGVASMTAVKTDGSGVTQPVSGPLTDTQLRASAVPVDTELPAAAALADGASNPTAPATGGFGMLWNGSTWDRAPGTAANGAATNLTKIAGTTVDTNSGTKSAGTQRVVLATDQPALTNALKVDPSAVTSPVSLAALPTLAAGTNNIGFVTVTPSTTGGWLPKVFSAAASAAKTLINAAACTFGGHLTIYNPNATVAYIQVFDAAATASVTVGTTVAVALIIVPATSAANVEVTNGVHMASGIVIAATTTATGSTGITTALDGTLLYK